MSFEEVYFKYYNKVFSYIYKRVLSHEDAEDLTDIVFYKCYRKFADYNSQKATISTWLYTITSNTLKNYYRDKKDYISLESPDVEALSDNERNEMLSAVLNEEMRNDLANALNILPEKNKKIIVLRYFQEKNFAEIAEIMKESEGNIRVIISRTLKKLKKYFDDNNIKYDL